MFNKRFNTLFNSKSFINCFINNSSDFYNLIIYRNGSVPFYINFINVFLLITLVNSIKT